MHVRMMPAQEPPYTRLMIQLEDNLSKLETYVKGSVVGFFTPELFHGIGSAGFHVHFANDDRNWFLYTRIIPWYWISRFPCTLCNDDRNFGGHVLDFEVEDVKVEIQNIETFEQHFPIHDEDFTNANIDYKDISDEIREAE